MPTIAIREHKTTDSIFEIALELDGQEFGPLTVADPFDAGKEAKLEWYFEGWIRRPYTDTAIAERAAGSVRELAPKCSTVRGDSATVELDCFRISPIGQAPPL